MGALSLRALVVVVVLLLGVTGSRTSELGRGGNHICDVDCLQRATGWEPEVELEVSEDAANETNSVQDFLATVLLDLDEKVVSEERTFAKDGGLAGLGLMIDNKVGEGRYASAFLVHIDTKVSTNIGMYESFRVGKSMVMKVPKFGGDETRNKEIARVMANEFAVMAHLSLVEDAAKREGREGDYKNIVEYYGYTYLEEDKLSMLPSSYRMIAPIKEITEEHPLESYDRRGIYKIISGRFYKKNAITAALYENCNHGDVQTMLDASDFTAVARGDKHDAYYRIMDGVLNGIKFLSKPVKIGSTGDTAMITHQDIKPANIFVCRDPAKPSSRVAKIGDFGLAQYIVKPKKFTSVNDITAFTKSSMMTVLGTEEYSPPEVHALGMLVSRNNMRLADEFHLSWNGFHSPTELLERVEGSVDEKKEMAKRIRWTRSAVHIDAIHARDIWSAGISFFQLLTNKPRGSKNEFMGWNRVESTVPIRDYILNGCRGKEYFDPTPENGSSSIWRDLQSQYGQDSIIVNMLQQMLSCNPLSRPTPADARKLLRQTSLRKAVRQNCFSHCVDGILLNQTKEQKKAIKKQLESRVLNPQMSQDVRSALLKIEEVCLNGVIRYDKEWPTVWQRLWGDFPKECQELNFVVEDLSSELGRRMSARQRSSLMLDDVDDIDSWSSGGLGSDIDDVSRRGPVYRASRHRPTHPSGEEYDLRSGEPGSSVGDDETIGETNRMFDLTRLSRSSRVRRRAPTRPIRPSSEEDEHETDTGDTTDPSASFGDDDELDFDLSGPEYTDDEDGGYSRSSQYDDDRRTLMRQSSFVSTISDPDGPSASNPGMEHDVSGQLGLDRPSPLLTHDASFSSGLDQQLGPSPSLELSGARLSDRSKKL